MVSDVKGTGSGSVKTVTTRPSGAQQPSSAGTAGAAAASGGDRSEVVTLTDLSARLQALTKSIELLPVVDQQRVAEIQQALQDGSYEIDAPTIAAKLVEFESLLARYGAQS